MYIYIYIERENYCYMLTNEYNNYIQFNKKGTSAAYVALQLDTSKVQFICCGKLFKLEQDMRTHREQALSHKVSFLQESKLYNTPDKTTVLSTSLILHELKNKIKEQKIKNEKIETRSSLKRAQKSTTLPVPEIIIIDSSDDENSTHAAPDFQDEIVCTNGNTSLTRGDLATLNSHTWLNDRVSNIPSCPDSSVMFKYEPNYMSFVFVSNYCRVVGCINRPLAIFTVICFLCTFKCILFR